MLGSGLWSLGAGLWVLGSGCWALGSGCWALGAGLWSLGSGRWALGSGRWVEAPCGGGWLFLVVWALYQYLRIAYVDGMGNQRGRVSLPSAKSQAPSAKRQAPSSQRQAPSAQRQAPSTQSQAPSAQHQAPSAQNPAAPRLLTFLHARSGVKLSIIEVWGARCVECTGGEAKLVR